MPRKGLLGGGKVSGSHSTVIDEAVPLIEMAKRLGSVKKIVLGVIDPARVGPRRLKIVQVPAGMRLTARGVHAAQKLFIYTDEFEAVETVLRATWSEKVQKV